MKWNGVGAIILIQSLLVVSMLLRGASVWLALKAASAIVVGSLIGLGIALALDRYGVVGIS